MLAKGNNQKSPGPSFEIGSGDLARPNKIYRRDFLKNALGPYTRKSENWAVSSPIRISQLCSKSMSDLSARNMEKEADGAKRLVA